MRREPLMKFTYKQGRGGLMYPEVQISNNLQTDWTAVGRFGSLWKDYMMEMHPHRLSELVAESRINEIILQVDEEAEQSKEKLIQELLTAQPMPETEDTLERAGHMNMIIRQAEEILLNQVVLKAR